MQMLLNLYELVSSVSYKKYTQVWRAWLEVRWFSLLKYHLSV